MHTLPALRAPVKAPLQFLDGEEVAQLAIPIGQKWIIRLGSGDI